MQRTVTIIIALVVAAVGAVVGPAIARRGPVYRLACPEESIGYAVAPVPDVPLVTGPYFAEVGDRFAVGGNYDPLPAGPPRIEGDATIVRYTDVWTAPVGRRCGRTVSGYRYHLYVARHAGDAVIGGHPVRISDRP